MSSLTRSCDQHKQTPTSAIMNVDEKTNNCDFELYTSVRETLCSKDGNQSKNSEKKSKFMESRNLETKFTDTASDSSVQKKAVSDNERITSALHDALAAVITSCDLDLFKTILEHLVESTVRKTFNKLF